MRPRPWELMLLPIPLLALLLAFAWQRPVPAEDACILFRYADHLAGGHGIVWNVGEDPVEGATEFLWMLALSGLARLGAPLLSAAPWAGLALAAAGAAALQLGSIRVMRAGVAAALMVSLAFAASTPALHAGTGFGTPLYCLLLLAAFYQAWRLATGARPDDRAAAWFPLTLLLLCLARPEGVWAGGLLYAALLVCRPALLTPRFLLKQALLLALPGLAYFAWRWSYFGYPLPNTFYVKSFPGLVSMESARRIARFLMRFDAAPLALIAIGAVRSPDTRRPTLAFTGVALLSMAAYLRFAMIQDLGFRFLFPSHALLMALAARPLGEMLARRGVVRAAGAVLAMAVLASGPWMLRVSGYHATLDDRFGIGKALAAFDPDVHTMMPTEAGYLPYLSRWKAVDPFGLNDEHIAHQGLTDEYIDARRPDLIMFHVDTAEYRERWTPPGADRWEAMTKTLHAYATSRGYELAAVIPKSARPEDGYHWYFVRPGGPDAAHIADLIRSRAPVAHAP